MSVRAPKIAQMSTEHVCAILGSTSITMMRSVTPVLHNAQIAMRKIILFAVGHVPTIRTDLIALQTIVHANLATLKTQIEPAIVVTSIA